MNRCKKCSKFLPKSGVCNACPVTKPAKSPSLLSVSATGSSSGPDTVPIIDINSPSSLSFSDILADINAKLSGLSEMNNKLDLCLSELAQLKVKVGDLNNRVDAVTAAHQTLAMHSALQEQRISKLEAAPCPAGTDDVIEELNDRVARARNIIIFELPEPQNVSLEQARTTDAECARTLLQGICPLGSHDLVVHRLGKSSSSKSRPLCVGLDSSATVKRILQNKHRYEGPCKISDDKTPLQRASLKLLREKLRDHHKKGESDMTIRYIRGVPKIVRGIHRHNSSPKNVGSSL